MSSTLGDLVGQNLAGQLAANRAIDELGGVADHDLLLSRLQAVLVTGEAERLRAFMRTLQKRIEAAR